MQLYPNDFQSQLVNEIYSIPRPEYAYGMNLMCSKTSRTTCILFCSNAQDSFEQSYRVRSSQDRKFNGLNQLFV